MVEDCPFLLSTLVKNAYGGSVPIVETSNMFVTAVETRSFTDDFGPLILETSQNLEDLQDAKAFPL